MAVEIRSITEDELESYLTVTSRGFGGDNFDGEAERVAKVIGLDRCHAALAEGRMVGTIGSFGFPLSVPGGADVPTAGLTRVTVASTHRRQGLLTAMMQTHFQDALDHNEPLSVLWASEVPIYGRYGYGPATELHVVSFDSRLAQITAPDTIDRMDLIESDEAAKILPDVHERARRMRPGRFGRSEDWWTHRVIADPKDLRFGKSSRRYVTASRDGETVGYVSFRQKENWGDDDLPNGEIHLMEIAAIDQQAEHSLWWHLANVDLFPNVKAWNQPTDGLLPWFATNPRAVLRRQTDGIHLRVLDVEPALSARRYCTEGELVFEVTDQRLPDVGGVFRLTIDADGVGRCTRTDAEPECRMDVFALGALYLGSVDPQPLAAVGRINPGTSVARLREVFSWPVAAWCDEGF